MAVAAMFGLAACGDNGGLVPTSGLQALDISLPVTIPRGLSVQLLATGTYDDGTTADLTTEVAWLTSDPMVATVEQDGLLAANEVGNTDIIATLGNTRKTVRATIGLAELREIETSASPFVVIGASALLLATGHFTDRDELLSARWESDHPEVIEVGPSGFATAVSLGVAHLTASQAGISSAPMRLEAIESRFRWFVMNSGPFGLASPQPLLLGQTLPLGVEGFDIHRGELIDATSLMAWSSEEPAIATVSPDGVVTPKARGLVTVTAQREGVAYASVVVISGLVDDLMVRPLSPVRVGDPSQAAAIAVTRQVSTADVTRQVTWSSSAPDVATVSDAGRTKGQITTHSAGQTVITAAINGWSSSATLVVEPVPPGR
jgi:hypothetical protein